MAKLLKDSGQPPLSHKQLEVVLLSIQLQVSRDAMHECCDPRVDRWPMTRRNTGAIRSGDETLQKPY